MFRLSSRTDSRDKSWGLHEVPMFATTLEHPIHAEKSKRSQSTYEAYRLSLDDHVSDGGADVLVKL